jgi:hypothetical protein
VSETSVGIAMEDLVGIKSIFFLAATHNMGDLERIGYVMLKRKTNKFSPSATGRSAG